MTAVATVAAVAAGPTVVAQTSDLIVAVEAGDYDQASALISDGVDVNVAQGDGTTALHWAVHRDDFELADLLLLSGAGAGAENELGATPLWLAALNGSTAMVERLLQANADPNTALKGGETALMTASRSGSVGVVELLLEHGGDPNAFERERGQTALMWAAAQRHPDVARLLIERGADLHAKSTVWHQWENTAGNANTSGNFMMSHGGSTPLLFAARNGDLETARLLVEAGADINDTAAAGTSPLVIAAHSAHELMAVYFLEEGADPNLNGAGYTALHAAVLRGGVELVDALLAYGADPNVIIQHGTPGRRISGDYSLRHQSVGANALWLAAQYGELEILRALSAAGGHPFAIPEDGRSALQAAMGKPISYTESRRYRSVFSPPDPVEEEQLSLEIARFLVDLGVDIDAADQRGNTALHDAVIMRFGSSVEFLVSQGADVDAKNERGQTPLVLAETIQTIQGSAGLRVTRPEIAKLLRRLGATPSN